MSWFIETCTSSLGKKYIMATTGLLLGGFLLVHAAGNSSIFWGRSAFISYARHLHSLGVLVNIFEVMLLAVFLVHITTGLSLFLDNRKARPGRYEINRSAGGRTWGSRTMPWTGLVILAFVLLHLANFHFTDHNRPIADIVTPILSNPFYTLLYGIGMAALGLHISHGFWSLFQSLGISHPRYDRAIRVLARLGWAAVIGVFAGILLLLLVAGSYLRP
ncbi:MAG TPA: succinate dehydrogenase cytochrome b subunit [Desulfobulbus sp.]|nr:succinate dehydrogenase cytochrome b subunit [Desulfobulbus sp.]